MPGEVILTLGGLIGGRGGAVGLGWGAVTDVALICALVLEDDDVW